MEGPEERKVAGPLNPKIILEFLGAVAGIAAFVTLVGGAVFWLRFDELGLPADRAVALLPSSLLLTVGAHALAVPAIAGLAAVIAIQAFEGRSAVVLAFLAGVIAFILVLVLWDLAFDLSVGLGLIASAIVALLVAVLAGVGAHTLGKRVGQEHAPTVLTLAVVGVAGAVVVISTLGLQLYPHLLIVALVVLAGVLAIFAAASRNLGHRPVLWIVFVSFLLAGAAVALTRTANEPKLEPVAVLLKDPEDAIAGFYVGESDDRIHLAQLRHGSGLVDVSAEPVEAIVTIPRDRVARMALRSPAGLGPTDAGRGQAETLLEELVVEQRAASGEHAPAAEPVATDEPVVTFAPLLSIHSHEPVYPTSVEYFLEGAQLFWSFRGNCDARLISPNLANDVDRLRLGRGGFTQARNCGDEGPLLNSSQYTRPHSKKRFVKVNGAPLELTGREGFYLDLEDRLRRPKDKKTTNQGSQKVLENVPVYYELHPEPDTPADDRRITYWFFYPFSIPPGGADKIAHEGDWERLSVLAERQDDGRWRPLTVRYHEHDTHVDVPWTDVRKVPDPTGPLTHPRAFVARGSHATYRRAGRFEQVLARGGVKIVTVKDDARACPECPLWLTWQRLVDALAEPWYGYGGAWGRLGNTSDFTGPLGPSAYKTLGLSDGPEQSLQQAVESTTAD
jgi:hypothetical protein